MNSACLTDWVKGKIALHVEESQALESAQFVSVGSYFVVTDGIVRDIKDVPRGHEYWKDGNPTESVAAFLENCDDFELISPAWQFNESELTEVITHWPNAWVKRIK